MPDLSDIHGSIDTKIVTNHIQKIVNESISISKKLRYIEIWIYMESIVLITSCTIVVGIHQQVFEKSNCEKAHRILLVFFIFLVVLGGFSLGLKFFKYQYLNRIHELSSVINSILQKNQNDAITIVEEILQSPRTEVLHHNFLNNIKPFRRSI